MEFDYGLATAGLMNAIDSYSGLMKERGDVNKKRVEKNQENMYMDPFQQQMALQYLRQNPGANFQGNPVMMSLQTLNNAQQGNKKGEEQISSLIENPNEPRVVLTSKGFVQKDMTKEEKRAFAFRIMDQIGQSGKMNNVQKDFLDEYYGGNDYKKTLKADEIIKVRNLARDLAERDLNGRMPSNEQIQSYMGKAMDILYPNSKSIDLTDKEKEKQQIEAFGAGVKDRAKESSKMLKDSQSKVKVINKNGVMGYIPREHLQKAIDNGYKQIKL